MLFGKYGLVDQKRCLHTHGAPTPPPHQCPVAAGPGLEARSPWSLTTPEAHQRLSSADPQDHPRLSSPPSLSPCPQGDGNIRYYEISTEKPFLSYLMEFRSPAPQKGLGKGGPEASMAVML